MTTNLVPIVIGLLRQRVSARRYFWIMDFFFSLICHLHNNRNLRGSLSLALFNLYPNFTHVQLHALWENGVHYPSVSTNDHPQTKKPEDSGCQIEWQHTKEGMEVNLNLFILSTQLEQFVVMFNVGKYQKAQLVNNVLLVSERAALVLEVVTEKNMLQVKKNVKLLYKRVEVLVI